METLLEELKKVLAGNESKVYLELLRRGSISVTKLAKKVSLDRTLTYQILSNLIEKGLVSYIIKENKKFFEAANPENLLNPIRKQEAFIMDIIPQLKKIEKIKEHPQEINVYEGKEGLRTFFNLVLKEREFLSFGSTGRGFYAIYEVPRIIKKALKSLRCRIIADIKNKGTPPFEIEKIEFRYLPIKSEATTGIFGDYISIHVLTQKPLIIIIKNKDIAESYRNYFEFLWKEAKS